MLPENNDNLITKAKKTAYNLLSVRSRSEKELIKRLTQKSFSQKVIRKIVHELKKTDLLNDAKFSEDWIQSKLKKGFGPKRITLELREKGVSYSVIIKELKKSLKNYSESSIIQELIRKRIQQYRKLEKTVMQRRLYGYLLRRGFSSDVITSIIKKYDNN